MAEDKKLEEKKAEQEKPKEEEKKDKSMIDSLKEGINQIMGDAVKGQRILNSTNMFKKGGKVSSASKRADGCAIRGKTRGRMV